MADASTVPIVPRKTVDWRPVREAFVQRPERSTYDELSAEFCVNINAIARVSADEGWPALRARHMDAQLEAADASAVILSVVKGDKTVTTAYLALAVVTMATLQGIIEEVRASDRAASTKADTINNCTFAAKNLAEALKTVGILGAGKLLADGAQKENGRWNEGLLQQINLTVQNLTGPAAAQAKGEAPGVLSAQPVDVPSSAKSEPAAVPPAVT